MPKNLLLAVLLAAAPLAAADSIDDGVGHTLGSNRFAAGGSVTVSAPTAGSLFAAGARVTVEAPVDGDAYLAGAHIELRAPIARRLTAAGAQLIVSGNVEHNAWLAGASVEVRPGARFGRRVAMAGGALSMAGAVAGDLQMAGGEAVLNGSVGGDAEIAAARIEVGPEARIDGRLRYRSDHEIIVAPGAQIAGGIERTTRRGSGFDWRDRSSFARHGFPRGPSWVTGCLLFGALLLWLAPGLFADTSRLARSAWPQSIGLGLVTVVAVPIVAVMLFITVIGIPLALLALALYVVWLLLGYLVGAVAVGDFALGHLAPGRAGSTGWRILGLLLALVALAFVREVPVIGGLAVTLVFFAGVGALCLRVFRHSRPPAAPAA